MSETKKYISYDSYVAGKIIEATPVGFEVAPEALNLKLFPYQADIVRWALRRGRAALFEYPGLGKSIQEWEFAKHTAAHADMPAIIFAPLSVAEQMAMEAPEFGYDINICKTRQDVRSGINITNYEKLHHFSPEDFGSIILDESGILKAGSFGKTATAINDFAAVIPFRLAGTATPAPNDMDEILYHAEVLGIMRESEAKALFFVQDGNSSNKFRLKHNARDAYYKWLASWAVALRKPSDLRKPNGERYSDKGFIRPPVNWQQITIDIDQPLDMGMLVQVEALGLTEQRRARNATLEQRVKATADRVNNSNEQWLVWCELNDESDALAKAIPDAVEVTGSDSEAHKIDAMRSFKGDICECEQKKRLENITENITGKTRTSGRNPEISGSGTPEAESFTLKTQKRGEKPLSKPKNGGIATRRHTLPAGSRNSIYPQTNTGDYSTLKAADAPSADNPREKRAFHHQDQKVESDDCMLTTTMQQGQCEDSYAHPAISESVNSKTISNSLIKRCNICGKPKQQARVVVSKASIWGFGLNFQHSWNMVFCGLGNSFEQYFQASKRQDRFGQTHIVNIYAVVSTADGAVVQNIKRKEREQDAMYDELIKHMAVHVDLGASGRQEMELPANTPLQSPPWLVPTKSDWYQSAPWIDLDSIPFQWCEAPEVTIGAAVGNVFLEKPRWLESVI